MQMLTHTHTHTYTHTHTRARLFHAAHTCQALAYMIGQGTKKAGPCSTWLPPWTMRSLRGIDSSSTQCSEMYTAQDCHWKLAFGCVRNGQNGVVACNCASRYYAFLAKVGTQDNRGLLSHWWSWVVGKSGRNVGPKQSGKERRICTTLHGFVCPSIDYTRHPLATILKTTCA